MAADNSGQAIMEVLQSTRRFMKEVALLLQTADRMMADADWTPYGNKAKVVSESIQSAGEWVPYCAFRYYKNPKRSELLPFISVLLGSYDDPDSFFVPLVNAGIYVYRKGEKLEWDFDMAQWHIGIRDRKDDGSIMRLNPQEQWPGDVGRCTAIQMVSFALPLTEIGNDQQLEAKVVKRLLSELSRI